MKTTLRILAINPLETQTQIYYVVDVTAENGTVTQDTFQSWLADGLGYTVEKAIAYAKTMIPETTEVICLFA